MHVRITFDWIHTLRFLRKVEAKQHRDIWHVEPEKMTDQDRRYLQSLLRHNYLTELINER